MGTNFDDPRTTSQDAHITPHYRDAWGEGGAWAGSVEGTEEGATLPCAVALL